MPSACHTAASRGGFTLVELLMGLVVSLFVLGGAIGLLISQWDLYRVQREVGEVTTTLRGASALLSWELREVSASGGDLYEIDTNSIKIRKVAGSAIACTYFDVGSARRRLGLREITGQVLTDVNDSALVHLPAADSWKSFEVSGVWDKGQAWASGGTPFGGWGDSSINDPRPDGAIEITGPAADVAQTGTGSTVYVFSRAEYGLFQQDGRWWLGRRIGTASDWKLVTGPMRSPTDGGLELRYYDALDSITTNSAFVAQIEIDLRAESTGGLPKWGSGSSSAIRVSVKTTLLLRNN